MGNTLRLAFVSFGFLGCSPLAPGTVGTLGGVLLAWLLARTEHFALWTVMLCVVLYVLGRSQGEWAERHAGGKDPGFFVVDEVIGYLVTVLWWGGPSLAALTVAFFVFRFFDIVKPPPVRRVEALGGGDGILLDDVVAGLYGLAVMALVRLLLLEPEAWTVAA
jgi:phosphatidylglycerophosphatase A